MLNPGPYFEDVAIGSALPELVKRPTTVQLFEFSAITWNPHRIHYDKEYALSEGHPDVLVHGPLQGAILGQFLTDWLGENGKLRRLSYSNRAVATPSDTLTCKGVVTDKYERDGENLIECEIWVEKQDGTRAAPGRAVAALPSRAG